MRLMFVAGAVKIAVGLAMWPWISAALPLPARALPTWYYVALLLIFGVSGAFLYFGGKSDVRARLLGVVLLLFGTLFTDRLVARALPSIPGPFDVGLAAIANVHLNALQPFVFWQFAWSFPRVQSALVPAWFPRFMARLALTAGIVLLLGNVIAHVLGDQWPVLRALGAPLSPNTDDGWFWQLTSILTLPSLGLLVAKLQAANADERRRLAWVVSGILIGAFPMVVHVFLATAVPRYAAFVAEPSHSRTLGILLTAFSLVIPAATAYAVLVDRVLEVRFIIRRAVQYALARYTVLGLMVALVVGLVSVGYGNRNRPLAELLGSSPLYVLALLLTAAVVLWRRALLEAIDRRFFREHYDAHRILVELVDKSRKAHTARDLMTLITSEVDRALHLERISMLVRDDEGDQLRDPEGRVPALEVDGPLGVLIAGSHTPLDVDLSSDSSALGRLPEADREWLTDTSARLIVPLLGAQGRPLGVLTLGDKRSELPFTQEDRNLMTAVAASAALALELKIQHESPSPDILSATRSHAARQCVVCGRVQERQHSTCQACGSALQEALLPIVLAGKFEIERQIGAGGMGVVYSARDLTLSRRVAIKVLPRVLPQAAARLRREARAMAMMHHSNLAVIHAMESWRGSPVLVLEFLSGGTLADRIRFRPLPVGDVVAVGAVMADVLHHVHRAGYLHRDIKPSNIGFTDEGVAKLLDFGLVRLVAKLPVLSPTDTTVTDGPVPEEPGRPDSRPFATAVHQFVGTTAYLSPEAVAASPPTQDVDLWALAVTLYEALTGKNPFLAPSVDETVSLIVSSAVADPRESRPDCPPALATFLVSALAADRRKRPQSAFEFASRLQAAGMAGTPVQPL
jgi:hypothetical protein